VAIDGGLDLRSDARPWGIPDGRNDPGKVFYSVGQWLKAGWQLGTSVRLQLDLHLKAKESSQHEFGFLVAGGAFNDVYRVGALNTYGGAGGLTVFGDLRFGPTGRYQVNIRGSWGFPALWLQDPPYIAVLAALGVRIF